MRKVIINTLLFVAGFTVVFASLGATASLIGQYLILYKTYINIVGGILIIILGLHLAGIFRINFLTYERRINVQGKPLGLLSSFLIGGAFAFGWTPCIGPILSSILLIAARRADQISSELAAHDYAVNRRAETLIEENTELTRIIKDLAEATHHQVVNVAPPTNRPVQTGR